METAELAYDIAQNLARRKENAIREALNTYFQREDWKPEEAGEVCSMHIYDDGREELLIDGAPWIHFGPIQSDTKLDNGGQIIVQYYQTIDPLYIIEPEQGV